MFVLFSVWTTTLLTLRRRYPPYIHLNLSPDSGKALYWGEVSNGENSFWRWTTPESLSLTLKIHIYQDKDPSEISSPPDDESCKTVVRSLTGALIYTVKS